MSALAKAAPKAAPGGRKKSASTGRREARKRRGRRQSRAFHASERAACRIHANFRQNAAFSRGVFRPFAPHALELSALRSTVNNI
ncbi:hypothetical protein [Caballeronia glathei]|nr:MULTISPECIES: hypothetical protein [Burkholderiaceae]